MQKGDKRQNLNIEEKREIVYSMLLRYSSRTTPLRQRAVDRLVLGSLLGSTEADPYRVGKISSNLIASRARLGLRDETIQESLQRLEKVGKAASTELRKRHAYFLSESGNKEVADLVSQSEDLFKKPIDRWSSNLGMTVNTEVAKLILRRFMLECFARYGRILAKYVTGDISHEDLFRLINMDQSFREACRGQSLNDTDSESLRSRSVSFIKSSHEDDQKLKFYLTQSYYIAELLGIDKMGNTFLGEEAFSGSVFYLDTNVLVGAILDPDDQSTHTLNELSTVAQRLNIELRVTRATINEARRIAAERREILEKITDTLPIKLLESTTRDQFLLAFAHKRETNPRITPDEFLSIFDGLSTYLPTKWSIEVDDRDENDLMGKRDFSSIGNLINTAALNVRGWRKSEDVLRHDVAHYAAVTDDRRNNPKTWFLTRDRTLVHAASLLDGTATSIPFTFYLLGFLHSISPFVTSDQQEDSFVDAFGSLLSEPIISTEMFFEPSELAILAEFNQDVISTPHENLVMALDYIKVKTLQGKQYREEDIPRVSLDIHKFLKSSRDEQIRALQTETQRLAKITADEESRRLSAESSIVQHVAANRVLKDKIDEISHLQNEFIEQIEDLRQQGLADKQKWRKLYAIVGTLCAILVWIGSNWLTPILMLHKPMFNYATAVLVFFRLLAAVLIAWPGLQYLKHADFSSETKKLVIALSLAAVVMISKFSHTQEISIAADIISLAVVGAEVVFLTWIVKPNK